MKKIKNEIAMQTKKHYQRPAMQVVEMQRTAMLLPNSAKLNVTYGEENWP